MKKKTRIVIASMFSLALLCASASSSRAQGADAEFQLAVAAYQESPTPTTAEKVIKLAAALDQLPAIPEEARKHFVRGAALFKDAKTPDDLKQVSDEFAQATHLAPWWPEARYNWAMALEAAGDYANAIPNLRLYQLFKLPEAEARAVQDKIYALELKQYVAKLQKDPNNNALREKVIKLALEMKPTPETPKEAERFMTRGSVALKNAKDANDFNDAIAEFEKATLAAPWMANAYYNLGVVQDKAGRYEPAIKSLRLYLLAAPTAPDTNTVEKLIYEIEYKQEKAVKKTQAIAAEEERRKEAERKEQERYGWVLGRWRFSFEWEEAGHIMGEGVINFSREGQQIIGTLLSNHERWLRGTIHEGDHTTWERNGNPYGHESPWVPVTLSFSSDRSSFTFRQPMYDRDSGRVSGWYKYTATHN